MICCFSQIIIIPNVNTHVSHILTVFFKNQLVTTPLLCSLHTYIVYSEVYWKVIIQFYYKNYALKNHRKLNLKIEMSKKKVLCKSIFQKSKFLSVYYLDELHGFVGEKQEIHQKIYWGQNFFLK